MKIWVQICLSVLLPAPLWAECYGQVHFEDLVIDVEIADTAKSRGDGLMHRTHLPALSGMLFAYGEDEPHNFWMKNTPLSLDILFYKQNGALNNAHMRTTPGSLDQLPGFGKWVLEVNAGVYQAHQNAMQKIEKISVNPNSNCVNFGAGAL